MVASSTSLSLVAATSGDQGNLEEIWCQANAVSLGFPYQSPFIDLLRSQFAMKLAQYIEQFPQFQSQLIMSDGNLVGYIWYILRQQTLQIIDIQVPPAHQNNGFGQYAIETIISRHQHSAKNAILTVERSNPAQRLYARLGFSVNTNDDVFFYMSKKLNEHDSK